MKPAQHFTVFFIVLALLLLAGCAPRYIPSRPAPHAPPTPPGTLADSVVQTARSQIGTPYRRAGAAPQTGFDCSGLVHWVYARHGFSLPRTAAGQLGVGLVIPVQDIRAGDLVFFRIGKNGTMHVGIATGRGSFVHSPKPGQRVREESLYTSYWTQRKIGVRRIL